jgi:hypothetical protein
MAGRQGTGNRQQGQVENGLLSLFLVVGCCAPVRRLREHQETATGLKDLEKQRLLERVWGGERLRVKKEERKGGWERLRVTKEERKGVG